MAWLAATRRDPETAASAEAAWCDGDRNGDARSARHLGFVLYERGDLDEALEAFKRGAKRGDPEYAFRVGFMLRRRGDRDGADAAFRRAEDGWRLADEQGDAEGAYRVGTRLFGGGDVAG